MIRRISLALAALLFATVSATAQSGCSSIATGAVLTAAQWNACFAAKQNVLGYTALNIAGGTMTGTLTTAASTTARAGFNIPQGVAPTSPVNGDVWTTTSGMFVQINGSTVGPISSVPTTGSARSVLGVTGNAVAANASIQGATDQILRVNGAGTALAFGSIDLSKSATVGVSLLGAANGGLGVNASSSSGIPAFNSGTPAFRTLTGTANEVTVTNGSGASGNPIVSLPSAITLIGKVLTGGTISGATITNGIYNNVQIGGGSSGLFGILSSSGDATSATQGNGGTRYWDITQSVANGNKRLIGGAGATAPASGAIEIDNGGAIRFPLYTCAGAGGFISADLNGNLACSNAASSRSLLGLGAIATQNANNVSITGGAITGMPTPTNPTDVANKSYADGISSGIRILPSVRLATAAVLPNAPVYNNGASGVGATLTAGSNGALSVDGIAVAVNDFVLVKNQATPAQNGTYIVTATGDASNPYVLTRATYFDTAAEMIAGSYQLISAGTANTGTAWVLFATVATVGTTDAAFYQYAGIGIPSIGAQTGAITLGTNLGAASSVLDFKYSVRLYGAVGNGSTNDAVKIQDAIDAACAANGGRVYLDALVYKINSTLNINCSNVGLSGVGASMDHSGGSPTDPATSLLWGGGASPMLNIQTPSGAGQAVRLGTVVTGINFDGAETATSAIVVNSVRWGKIDMVSIKNTVTSGITMTSGVSFTDCAEACDTQGWVLSQINMQLVGVSSGSAHGLLLTGSSNANTSFNTFTGIRGSFLNGSWVRLQNTDNNTFNSVGGFRYPGGTGYNIEIYGSTAGGFINSDNVFINATCPSGECIIRGTSSGFAAGTKTNIFNNLDITNGSVLPTIEAGSCFTGNFNGRPWEQVCNPATGVSSCGTSPSIVGTDYGGVVTVGTGSPSSCRLTFATPTATVPYFCTFSGNSGGVPTSAGDATGYTLSGTLNQFISYTCARPANQ